MDVLRHFARQQIAAVKRPHLRAGDIVRVETKVTEGEKTRLQTFEGTVLGVRGSGPSATFTVRRVTSGFGVERIFPLYTPLITAINIVKRQKVRRAKLTYLRKAGHRRVKEDANALQRHLKEQADAKRLADLAAKASAKEAESRRRAEEEKAQAEHEAKKQEEATQAEEKK